MDTSQVLRKFGNFNWDKNFRSVILILFINANQDQKKSVDLTVETLCELCVSA